MTFWTCLSKVLFPERSIKMIDGVEKRNRQLALNFRIRMLVKSIVKSAELHITVGNQLWFHNQSSKIKIIGE